MYTVSHTVIMCTPACLQVLKTTLDLPMRTFESQIKEDNSTVDIVTHGEGCCFFFFSFFLLAVCTGLLSSGERVHVSAAEELDPAQEGSRRTNQDLQEAGNCKKTNNKFN